MKITIILAVIVMVFNFSTLEKEDESVANELKIGAILLDKDLNNEWFYNQNFIEVLTIAFKGVELSPKFYNQKLYIYSTLYNYLYQPQTANFYKEYANKEINFNFGERLGQIKLNAPVNSISFSPDGKKLASASSDQTIKIWDLEIEAILPLACEVMMNNMENWIIHNYNSKALPLKDVKDTLKKCKQVISKKTNLGKKG